MATLQDSARTILKLLLLITGLALALIIGLTFVNGWGPVNAGNFWSFIALLFGGMIMGMLLLLAGSKAKAMPLFVVSGGVGLLLYALSALLYLVTVAMSFQGW